MINDQWCDAKITKIIPPTQEEIDKDKEEQEDDDVSNINQDKTMADKLMYIQNYDTQSYPFCTLLVETFGQSPIFLSQRIRKRH